MIVYNEASLNDSEVFQGINNINPNAKLHEKAINLIKTAKHLTTEDIETAYISVRQISDSLTRSAIKAFDEQKIVLIYNNDSTKSISQALPFITFKRGTDYTTYVFMDKWIHLNRDGIIQMDSPVLRDLLTGALVANGLKKNYTQLTTNQFMQKLLMELYTKFFIRVINRDFSIAANKEVLFTIQYWINRFFLEKVMNAADSPENIDLLAMSHIKDDMVIDESKMSEIRQKYNEVSPIKASQLMELVKTASPRMKGLTFGSFIGSWTQYYYAPATLAIDNIDYLIFMILTLLAGNNIINISASEVVKEQKGIKQFKPELLKLI